MKMRLRSREMIVSVAAILALDGCSWDDGSSHQTNATYSLSGTVSGLSSGSLVLAVNGNTITVPANTTSVSLASALPSGTGYTISVQTQPTGETCSVAGGMGTIGSADIANIVVTCATQAFTLGGTITGLTNSGLVLSNGSDTLTVDSSANHFTLPTQIAYTSSYDVTVKTQPTGLSCSVAQGSGAMPASAVTNVIVTCSSQPFSITGTIVGLGNNAGLILTNGGDSVTLNAGAATFAMPTRVAFGSTYAVSVGSTPAGLSCSVANGSGTMGAGNVTGVIVTCSDQSFGLSGTINGLNAAGLQLANGNDVISLNAGATAFTMNDQVAFTGSYNVQIRAQPSNEICAVANGQGIMGAAAVTHIQVACGPTTFTLGGTITGLNTNTGLVLLNNGADATPISANATLFTMTNGAVIGSGFDITVGTQPYGITLACGVSNGTGTATQDVTSVAVNCNSVTPQQQVIASYFSGTYGIALDSSGNVFVADMGNGAVKKLPFSNGSYGMPVTIASGLNSPIGVAVDAHGNVFVADDGDRVVKEIPFVNGSYTTPVTIGPGISNPLGVALDAAGNVFVGDYGAGAVKEILVDNGNYDQVVTVSAGLDDPTGLTVDAAGNVFVAELADVKKIPFSNGTYAAPVTVYTGYTAIDNVAVDASGNVFVADLPMRIVREIPWNGSSYGASITVSSTAGSPWGLAVDPTGNLFVADRDYSTIFELPVSNGTYSQTVKLNTGIQIPYGMAVDANGNVFITDIGDGTIKTALLAAGNYSTPMTVGSGFNNAVAVALDAAGNVFVADTYNNAVKEIPFSNGSYGTPITLASGIYQPGGIAVDSTGNVFVSEDAHATIQEIPYNAGGYGVPVVIASGFNNPWGVAVDGADNVFVADSTSILRVPYSSSGYGSPQSIASGMASPYGVAVDRVGNVFVADTYNNLLKKIPFDGSSYGTPVSVASGLRQPRSVAIDSHGRVYVDDNGTLYILHP